MFPSMARLNLRLRYRIFCHVRRNIYCACYSKPSLCKSTSISVKNSMDEWMFLCYRQMQWYLCWAPVLLRGEKKDPSSLVMLFSVRVAPCFHSRCPSSSDDISLCVQSVVIATSVFAVDLSCQHTRMSVRACRINDILVCVWHVGLPVLILASRVIAISGIWIRRQTLIR